MLPGFPALIGGAGFPSFKLTVANPETDVWGYKANDDANLGTGYGSVDNRFVVGTAPNGVDPKLLMVADEFGHSKIFFGGGNFVSYLGAVANRFIVGEIVVAPTWIHNINFNWTLWEVWNPANGFG
ncbi:MAG: hypothetical protein M3Q08_07235 [Pseudomonadota bacterium]|nr:hypothetical protein [Pseudomonadota bacterium]